jgi:hypothetical protein
MVEASYQATRQDPALAMLYRRLKLEKGSAVARVAVARKLLSAVWHVLSRQQPCLYRQPNAYHPGTPDRPAGQPSWTDVKIGKPGVVYCHVSPRGRTEE